MPSADSLRLAGRVAESIVDGPGIRYTVFVQGCPHGCPACHNPQTHDFAGGTVVSVARLCADIVKRSYTKAVTLSGGEPFCQAEALAQLARTLRAQGFDVMCYTGYTYEQLQSGQLAGAQALLSTLSLLVDGRFESQTRDIGLHFRGSRNQRVIDVPASLAQGQVVLSEKYT